MNCYDEFGSLWCLYDRSEVLLRRYDLLAINAGIYYGSMMVVLCLPLDSINLDD